jgi:hypothetical protein
VVALSVPAPGQGLDVAGSIGLVAEGDPDLLDAEVEALVEVDERVAAPDLAAELFTGDDVTGAGDEQRQDLERLLLQLDEHPALTQLAVAEIDLEHPEANHRPLPGPVGRWAHGRLWGHLVP